MIKYAPIQLKEKRFFDIIGFDIFIKTFWIYASKSDVFNNIETDLKPLLDSFLTNLIAGTQLIVEASEEKKGVIKIYDNENQDESNSALNISNSLSLFVLKSNYDFFNHTAKESCQSKLAQSKITDFCEQVFITQQKI